MLRQDASDQDVSPGSDGGAAETGAAAAAPGAPGPALAGPAAAGPEVVATVADWFARHRRDLPWRAADAGPWAVLVSEFMLQQTPVSRVLPVYAAWLERWPKPGDLAAEQPGEAVRAWGRLGYPRRALRLHASAVAIATEHGGKVPTDYTTLRTLPGVGDYTAAAITSFAYGGRAVVLDTNVRRVLTRVFTGAAQPGASVSAAERALAEVILPEAAAAAAGWAAGSMELGALVCTARTPDCGSCPLAKLCAWNLAGRPAHDGPARRVQGYEGTDRQVRGRLMAILRAADEPVGRALLAEAWPDREQRDRALASLVVDGLAVELPGKRYQLP
jgi:A/G-specific adenine glycosylase